MAQFIAYVLIAVLVIAVIVRFKVFFIALAVLAVSVIAARKIYKRKKNQASLPTPSNENPALAPEPPKPTTVTNRYEVAGVEYYLKNLQAMMEPNYLYSYKKQDLIDTCNYDVPIYKTVIPEMNLQLVQEDDNPHDPNAVVVLINDKIVGYIARKDCKHIRHLMDNDMITKFTCEVYGGKYKQVNEEYDFTKDRSTYTMESGEDEYGITIVITEKTE